MSDHKRACELAAYFAKLNLSKHRTLVLEKALEVFLAKPKEFSKTFAAAPIAHRLLEHVRSKLVTYEEKVKSGADVQVDQELKLDYDDNNPYDLCAATLKPIYRGNRPTRCPLCDAKYSLEFEGQTFKVRLLYGSGLQLRAQADLYSSSVDTIFQLHILNPGRDSH